MISEYNKNDDNAFSYLGLVQEEAMWEGLEQPQGKNPSYITNSTFNVYNEHLSLSAFPLKKPKALPRVKIWTVFFYPNAPYA